MDFWSVDTQKEIGHGKAPCATKIDWSACGRYILTRVLYERLKVDNGFTICRANGTKVIEKPETFQELYTTEWQPHEVGVLSKPSVEKLKKIEVKSESSKPKKTFKFGKGGDNSAFQQMMRQQMATEKHSDKAAKKVDPKHYQELQEKQTLKAQEIIQA